MMTFEEAVLWMLYRAARESEEQKLHFLRVGYAARKHGEDVGIIGLLHDLVEDGHSTVEEIEAHFGSEIAYSVWLLTNSGEDYINYIHSMTDNIPAMQVKYADIKDNLARKDCGSKWFAHRRKYEAALHTLECYMGLDLGSATEKDG